MKSYKRIESLTDDLFCTNDIKSFNGCMKVFDQFVQNGSQNFPYCGEINLALVYLKDE